MGRPWWYDNYWNKNEPPRRRRKIIGRQAWMWIAVAALSLLLAAAGAGFRFFWLDWLLGFVDYACYILALVIFIYTLLPWFGIGYYTKSMLILGDLVTPILTPLRRAIPLIGRLDLSPLAAIIILYVLPLIVRWILLLFLR
jgi:YggT family protein